jgi:glyoxalase family protein
MAGAVAYAVPEGGLNAWMARFAERAINFDGPVTRFGERMLALRDPDGLQVELIETARAAEADAAPADDGFHSVTLWLRDPEPSARLLTELFGYEYAGEEAATNG